MAKNLASKLRTGAMVGLAALAVSAPMKAKADFIPYDSGLQSVTNTVPAGKLIISYQQTINEVDTDNNGTLDAYRSSTVVRNDTYNINETEGAFWAMNMNADLAGRGCTNMIDQYSQFHYEKNGENMSKMILNSEGLAMLPTYEDTFYYTISKDKVLGWENVGASMVANAGSVSFGFQAPKAIPEPTTMAILASGAVAILAGRRLRDRYK